MIEDAPNINSTEPVPLTEWKNEPSLADLKQNIEDADTDCETHKSNVSRWLDNRNMTGSAAPTKVKGRSSIAPKVIRKQAEWRYSSLAAPFTSTPDLFNVSPKTAGDRLRAQQNALVLNQQFNSYIDKISFIDEYVRSAVDTGTVVVEVSWVTEEEAIVEEVPTYDFIPSQDPQLAQQYMQLAQLRQTSEDAYQNYMNPGLDQAIQILFSTGTLVEAVQTGIEEVSTIQETANYPELEIIESENILIDPSCNGDYKKAQFMAKKFKASISDLRKDGKYTNLDQIMIEAANPLADPDYKDSPDISTFEFKDDPRKQFVVYTYWGSWDIHDTGTTVPIVASWTGNTLIRMEENPFPFKRPPFIKSVYMPVRKSVYGEPDSELLEDNQKVIGAITRGAIDLMGKSANGQLGTRAGWLDAANKRKFARGDDYEFNGNIAPKDAIHTHVYPEIPASVYNILGMQNNEVESMSGVKAFTSGINSKALGESVGGGRDAMDAASKRESGILKRLASGIKEIGRMVIAMNAVFLSEEEVVRITDEEFVTVRRDDLAGTFDIELSISTAEEDNQKASELAFMLQTTGNNMDNGLRNMILSDIARLRKMPDLAKRIEEYEPAPDPMAVKEAELQLALLEAQIAKERALEAKHLTEAEANNYRGYKDGTQGDLNASKVSTEEAKSRDLHSTADKKDVDYLEQVNGVPHERDIQKQDRKALNDLEAEVVKAELNNNKQG